MQKPDVRKMIMEEAKKIGETRYIDTVTVKEICAKCGISRPTFYAYFHDKYDLVNKIHYSTIEEAFKASEQGAPWNIVIGNIMTSIRGSRKFYMNSIKYSGQNALKDIMLEYTYKGYVLVFIKRSGIEPDKDLLNDLRFNAYGTTGLMLDWIRAGMKEDPYKIAQNICICMPDKMKPYYL